MTTTAHTTVRPGTRVTVRRIVQYVLDLFLAGLLLAGLGALADRIAPGAGFEQISGQEVPRMAQLVATGGGWPSAAAVALTVLAWAVVFVAVPLRWSRTPAMVLTGLRIVRVDGGRPSAVQHVVRAVFLLVDGAGGGLLGWLVIVFSRNRQRIGDHATETLVVRG